MRVWAVVYDEDDQYDNGAHDAVVDLFLARIDAELVASHLIGLPKDPYSYASVRPPLWGGCRQLADRADGGAMSGRKFAALAVAVLAVPSVVAGVAIGTAVAIAADRLRSALRGPLGYWGESDDEA